MKIKSLSWWENISKWVIYKKGQEIKIKKGKEIEPKSVISLDDYKNSLTVKLCLTVTLPTFNQTYSICGCKYTIPDARNYHQLSVELL